jgi:hypothetical protein
MQEDVLYALSETIARGQLESADTKSGPEVGRKFRRVLERLAKRSLLDAERSTSVFDRIRRKMKQYGREAPAEICPPLVQEEQPPLGEAGADERWQ